MDYQIAQFNVGRMLGDNIEAPIMKEFVDNIAMVNALAEKSSGFIWRMKDENNNATSFNPFNDQQIIINLSVWESVEALEAFTYKSLHTNFLKRRKEWFSNFGKPHFVLWWIEKGKYPSLEVAKNKLEFLQENGPTEKAFNFRMKFPPS